MELDKDHIIIFLKDKYNYILAGICVFILGSLLMLLQRQYIILILAIVSIIAIGLESRARSFDITVSCLVILTLAIGFLFFG